MDTMQKAIDTIKGVREAISDPSVSREDKQRLAKEFRAFMEAYIAACDRQGIEVPPEARDGWAS